MSDENKKFKYFVAKDIKQSKDKKGNTTLTVPIQSLEADRDGDTITQEGQNMIINQLQSGNVPAFPNHGFGDSMVMYDFREIMGQWTGGEVNNGITYGYLRLRKGNSAAEELLDLINQNMPVGFSIGFIPKSYDEEKDGISILELDLLEVSPVGIPSNAAAVQGNSQEIAMAAKSAIENKSDIEQTLKTYVKKSYTKQNQNTKQNEDVTERQVYEYIASLIEGATVQDVASLLDNLGDVQFDERELAAHIAGIYDVTVGEVLEWLQMLKDETQQNMNTNSEVEQIKSDIQEIKNQIKSMQKQNGATIKNPKYDVAQKEQWESPDMEDFENEEDYYAVHCVWYTDNPESTEDVSLPVARPEEGQLVLVYEALNSAYDMASRLEELTEDQVETLRNKLESLREKEFPDEEPLDADESEEEEDSGKNNQGGKTMSSEEEKQNQETESQENKQETEEQENKEEKTQTEEQEQKEENTEEQTEENTEEDNTSEDELKDEEKTVKETDQPKKINTVDKGNEEQEQKNKSEEKIIGFNYKY